MSRSFKNTPICKDNDRGRKFAKRQANKQVRSTPFVACGGEYRKVFNPWDIYDYVSRCTLKEWLHLERLWRLHEVEENMIYEWKKWYYRK